MNVQPTQTNSTDHGLPLNTRSDPRAESWQAAWLRRAIPLVMALHFSSSRRPAPDVYELRRRAHRYTLPGRLAAAWLYPRMRRHADPELKGEWIDPPGTGQDPASTVVLYLHGGAYYFGSPATHRAVTVDKPAPPLCVACRNVG